MCGDNATLSPASACTFAHANEGGCTASSTCKTLLLFVGLFIGLFVGLFIGLFVGLFISSSECKLLFSFFRLKCSTVGNTEEGAGERAKHRQDKRA